MEEIIFFFDGDTAGQKAVVQYGDMLSHLYPKVQFTNIELPDREDINSLLDGHEPEILTELLNQRKPIHAGTLSSSNETKDQDNAPDPSQEPEGAELNTDTPERLTYTSEHLTATV